jgi:hypothetical protein
VDGRVKPGQDGCCLFPKLLDRPATNSQRYTSRLLQGGLVVALATQDPARFEAALDDLKPVLSGGRS